MIQTDQQHRYLQKLGTLGYPSNITRPDLAFAASRLARYSKGPSSSHERQVNHSLRYGYLTRDLSIRFSRDQASLIAAADSSFADDPDTRRSSQGYIFILFGGAVVWKASRQPTVSTSTTEAELLALAEATKERIALGRQLEELGIRLPGPAVMWCDNLQTVRLAMSQTPRLQTRLRHVDIQGSWLREVCSSGQIEVRWISTKQMPADGLTKSLTRQAHEDWIKLINLQPRPDSNHKPTHGAGTSDIEGNQPANLTSNHYPGLAEKVMSYLMAGLSLDKSREKAAASDSSRLIDTGKASSL